MTNEPPGSPWGYWWTKGSNLGPTITDACKKLNETFKSEKINIPISGPDWVSLPLCEPEKMDFEKYLGAFDIHSYFGIYTKKGGEQIISDWVKYAASKNKPFFITEIGNMDLGYKNHEDDLSVLMINNLKEPVTIDISLLNVSKKQACSFYQVTEPLVKSPDFKLNPQKVYKNLAALKSCLLLPESISVLTTNGLKQESAGVIE